MIESVEHFQIHSLVRSVETRHHRMLSPERHRFSMLLGAGLLRVIRKRPTTVTRGMIERLLPELMEKEKRGMLMVTTLQGQRVDLSTMQAVAGPPATPPMPEPPLDSAANDETFEAGVGEAMPQTLGGLPQTADVGLPAVVAERAEEVAEAPPSTPGVQTRRRRR